jgi:predicted DNA-binding transcriptional regulator AlpA
MQTQPARYLRASDLCGTVKPRTPGILPFSPNTLWRKVRAGQFPAPVKLGPNITAWSASAVQAWMDEVEAQQ